MWYLIVALVLALPFAFAFSLHIRPEDGFEYCMTALGGLLAAVFWPISLFIGALVYGIKALERVKNGSRLQINWKHK